MSITSIARKNKRLEKRRIKNRNNRDKPKRNISAAVHNFCYAAIFRVIEAVILFFFISITSLAIGSTAIPLLAYEMSAGFGLTQSTHEYIAVASWMLPMLFYTLLITAATFCVYRRFIKWLHGKFTAIINKKMEKTEADDDRKENDI